MPTNRLTYILIGLLSSTLFFASKELLGNGFGWIGIAIGLMFSTILTKKLTVTSLQTQVLSTSILALVCGAVLFGAVRFNKRNTTKDSAIIQGEWEAVDRKGKYRMEVKQDSTYLSVSGMPNRASFVLQLSEDSLILAGALGNTLAFRLDKLTEKTLEVGKGDSKLIFHKKK